MNAPHQHYYIERLFDGETWKHCCYVTVNDEGMISDIRFRDEVNSDVESTGFLGDDEDVVDLGTVVPGMPNLHSHAFQRAMIGLAEARTAEQDSFWTWREQMYRIALQLSPEQLEVIATQLYLEMLQGGYTSVCEFHYLHHDPDGKAYADCTEMAQALIRAARTVGIDIMLLPVLYRYGGFGQQPPEDHQRRFIMTVEDYLQYHEKLNAVIAQLDAAAGSVRHGIAFHSLRAVTCDDMHQVIDSLPDQMPIHIHIAEQLQEVEDCQTFSGLRPVNYLATEMALNPRWCLVHATHLDQREIGLIADSGATVAMCPTTEANLGDGIMPLMQYQAAGGNYGIGSDSQVCRSSIEELRWLEYVQRLVMRQRTVLTDQSEPHNGLSVWARASLDKQSVTGRREGLLKPGYRANWVELDRGHASLVHAMDETVMDCLVFAADHSAIRSVTTGGICRVLNESGLSAGSQQTELEKVLAGL